MNRRKKRKMFPDFLTKNKKPLQFIPPNIYIKYTGLWGPSFVHACVAASPSYPVFVQNLV